MITWTRPRQNSKTVAPPVAFLIAVRHSTTLVQSFFRIFFAGYKLLPLSVRTRIGFFFVWTFVPEWSGSTLWEKLDSLAHLTGRSQCGKSNEDHSCGGARSRCHLNHDHNGTRWRWRLVPARGDPARWNDGRCDYRWAENFFSTFFLLVSYQNFDLVQFRCNQSTNQSRNRTIESVLTGMLETRKLPMKLGFSPIKFENFSNSRQNKSPQFFGIIPSKENLKLIITDCELSSQPINQSIIWWTQQ